MFGANIQTLALVQERHDDKELDCPPILGECCVLVVVGIVIIMHAQQICVQILNVVEDGVYLTVTVLSKARKEGFKKSEKRVKVKSKQSTVSF